MAQASASPDRQAGFTLLELLVAITLFSLLSLVLTSSLQFGLTAWARGADHAERVDQNLVAEDFLRRTIGDAYPHFSSADPTRGGGRVEFVGTATSIAFLASAPLALGGRGRARFEVSLVGTGKGSDLVVTSTPELSEATVPGERKVLMHGVERVEFAYFGRKRAEKQAAWHDAWAGEPAVPQLVRIKLRFADDGRPWPELVVATRITADVGCVHDPLTKLCRGR